MTRRRSHFQAAIELLEQEEKAFTVLERRVQNASSFIGKMPLEILLSLLQTVVDQRFSKPEVLMRVCHRWRTVVRGDHGAELWANCTVRVRHHRGELKSLKILETSLALSRNKQLSLTFSASGEAETSDYDLPLSLVGNHMWRVKSIAIHELFEDVAAWLPFKVPTPSLRRIELRGPAPTANQVFLFNAPLLRKVKIHTERAVPFHVHDLLQNISAHSNLTYLTLLTSICPGVPMVQFFRSFPGLTYFNWRCGEGRVIQAADDQVILFPKLETLILQGVETCVALRSIQAPLVRTLHISVDQLFRERTDAADAVKEWLNPNESKFPALQTLSFPVHRGWNTADVLMALEGLVHLEKVEIQCPLEDFPDDYAITLKLLRSLLIQSDPNTLFPNLRYVFLAHYPSFPRTRFLNGGVPSAIISSLAGLMRCQDLLWSERPKFSVGISSDAAESTEDLQEMVESYPLVFAYSGKLPCPDPWDEPDDVDG